MLEREAAELKRIRQYLDAGQTEEAFHLLRQLKENASEELQKSDMWQMHELFGACFHDFGDAEGAAQAYLQAARSDRFLRSQRQHFSSYLFALHYLPQIPDEEMARQNLAYGSLYRDVTPFPLRGGRRQGRIRVGYLAPSFSEQAAARFYEVMLMEYDRDAFEVFCYSMEPSEDAFAEAVRKQVEGWRVLPELEPEKAARIIRQDGIDILVDLGGHSEGGMTLAVMAYHPAKVQVSGIGWMDTTGLPAMDYLLADGHLVPAGCHEEYFSERLLRLAYAFCWRPTEEMRRIPLQPRKKGSPVRLGCFNNFMKVTDDMLRLWRSILEQLPEAVLVLQDASCHPARQREMKRRIREAGLAGRVEVCPASMDYLERIGKVDIALDTYPYTGGGMTAVSLYMGTPVISLAGTRYGSRFGVSLLQSIGMQQCIAQSPKEYVAKAVELARDEHCLTKIQNGLRERMEDSPLMDGKGYMRELEQAYRRILGVR
ncbi:MAG: hypothetical protein IJT01_00460 [Selenomonadaceae bacterium]|nr:hypothetical protein [Selenomonadaceae bacterium]